MKLRDILLAFPRYVASLWAPYDESGYVEAQPRKPMKPRTVIVTVEIHTSVKFKELDDAARGALSPFGEVLQVSTNVIKAPKKKATRKK